MEGDLELKYISADARRCGVTRLWLDVAEDTGSAHAGPRLSADLTIRVTFTGLEIELRILVARDSVYVEAPGMYRFEAVSAAHDRQAVRIYPIWRLRHCKA